jgi:hypothetical protein
VRIGVWLSVGDSVYYDECSETGVGLVERIGVRASFRVKACLIEIWVHRILPIGHGDSRVDGL